MVTTNVGLPDGPECKAAERDKYVNAQVSRLDKAAERQVMFRGELESRLTPVIQGSTPETSGMNPEEGTGVPLAEELAAIARRLELTNNFFEDILNRLEI